MQEHLTWGAAGVEAPALSKEYFLPISFYFLKVLFLFKSLSPFCFPEVFLVNS